MWAEKWEYVVEKLADVSAIEDRLSELGAQGWEFADAIETVNAGVHLVFKRRAQITPRMACAR